MLAVLAPGPSSKVSATVLPLPGAVFFAPYGAAGQLVDTCGGTATWPLGIRAGGPAGPSLPGGGGGVADAAAETAEDAGNTVNTPVTASATATANSRIREPDTGISKPAPTVTRTAGAPRN